MNKFETAGSAHEFRQKSSVIYPGYGLGKIVAIEKQEVAGAMLECYAIAFERDGVTIRVPTAKAHKNGMRPPASSETLERALEVLGGSAQIKREMWSRRAQEYEAKINSGDLITLAEVVRDLCRAGDGVGQSYSERQLLEKAVSLFLDEAAAIKKWDTKRAARHVAEVTGKSLTLRSRAKREQPAQAVPSPLTVPHAPPERNRVKYSSAMEEQVAAAKAGDSKVSEPATPRRPNPVPAGIDPTALFGERKTNQSSQPKAARPAPRRPEENTKTRPRATPVPSTPKPADRSPSPKGTREPSHEKASAELEALRQKLKAAEEAVEEERRKACEKLEQLTKELGEVKVRLVAAQDQRGLAERKANGLSEELLRVRAELETEAAARAAAEHERDKALANLNEARAELGSLTSASETSNPPEETEKPKLPGPGWKRRGKYLIPPGM